jgi:hypothetical protein
MMSERASDRAAHLARQLGGCGAMDHACATLSYEAMNLHNICEVA